MILLAKSGQSYHDFTLQEMDGGFKYSLRDEKIQRHGSGCSECAVRSEADCDAPA